MKQEIEIMFEVLAEEDRALEAAAVEGRVELPASEESSAAASVGSETF
jgi:hypothetical protein